MKTIPPAVITFAVTTSYIAQDLPCLGTNYAVSILRSSRTLSEKNLLKPRNDTFILFLVTSFLAMPGLLASTKDDLIVTYFLGDRFERQISQESGKLIGSSYEGKPFENPLDINYYDDPDLLKTYLSSMTNNLQIFNYTFFNHPSAARITSVKEWVSYRLNYHLEKVKKMHFMGDPARPFSRAAQADIKRIADSIPHKIVKNIFLHSLLAKVYELPMKPVDFYRQLTAFLKTIGYIDSPVGFIGVGHCRILRKTQSVLKYCFEDESILEKHLERISSAHQPSESHIVKRRSVNLKTIEIFKASLEGLGLSPQQVVCEDFNNRVYTSSQASGMRPYYFRTTYRGYKVADYFHVGHHLSGFLVGNTNTYKVNTGYRAGFYFRFENSEQVFEISGDEAKWAYRACVAQETPIYQDL